MRVGTVIDNNDPKKMGRVRIRIPNVHNDVADNELPWSVNMASSSGSGAVNVPKTGDQVYANVDGNQPGFMGSVVSASTLGEKLATNYPSRKGFVTESGVSGFVDVATGLVEFDNGAGCVVALDPGGNVSLNGVGTLNLSVSGNITITGPAITLAGNVEITGDLNVGGDTSLKDTTINDIVQIGP